jgi:hypothetical protein
MAAPPLSRLEGHVELLRGEEALLDAEVDRSDVDDRDDADLQIGGAVGGSRSGGAVAAGRDGQRGEECENESGAKHVADVTAIVNNLEDNLDYDLRWP